MKIKNGLVLCLGLVMVALLSGCQGDERIAEVSAAQTEAQIKAEQSFREEKAKGLEEDLSKRQNFYQSVSGIYEGTVETQDGTYSIRVRLIPSTTLYRPNGRVRTAEEIVSDINNLFFKAQIVQWKPGSNIGVLGCRVDNISPDLTQGIIVIASPDCPSFYQIKISSATDAIQARSEAADTSRYMASDLTQGKAVRVNSISGEVFPTSNTASFPFFASRKERR